MNKEKWKPIKGFEDYYEISSQGRIKSIERAVKTKSPRSKTGLMSVKAKILRQKIGPHGYSSIILAKNAIYSTFLVHRLVAFAFCPNPENKKQVNHLDGNKLNNNSSNLEWATQSENINHIYQKIGHKQLGATHKQAKTSDEEVRECIAFYETGQFTHLQLSIKYKVSTSTIRDWIKGKYRLKTYG